MHILILGSGGREHAIALKISQSPDCKKLFIAQEGGLGDEILCARFVELYKQKYENEGRQNFANIGGVAVKVQALAMYGLNDMDAFDSDSYSQELS